MTKVTITFTVDETGYNTYEDILDDFANELDNIGAEDFEVKEDEV